MNILEGAVQVPKSDLEEIAKMMAASGELLKAYELVRRYTGWGLREAKEYVENGFKIVIKKDTLVACKDSKKRYYVRAILNRGDEIFYWCEPADHFGSRSSSLSPKTYRADDITMSLV